MSPPCSKLWPWGAALAKLPTQSPRHHFAIHSGQQRAGLLLHIHSKDKKETVTAALPPPGLRCKNSLLPVCQSGHGSLIPRAAGITCYLNQIT